MVPARGQTVLVRNEAIGIVGGSGTDDSDDEVCYVIPRAAGKVPKIYRHENPENDTLQVEVRYLEAAIRKATGTPNLTRI